MDLNNVKNSIPVIGTAVVGNPYWVSKLLKSVDYPVENFFIINNSGKGEIDDELNQLSKIKHEYIKSIKVTHMPSNIGCSGAWNLIIKCYMNSPYWIIVNDDISFEPGTLKKMYQSALDSEVGIVHGSCGNFDLGSWDLFLIKDWIIQKYGLFDENLYPAYCEDCDYIMRIHHDQVKREFLMKSLDDTPVYKHGDGHPKDYDTMGAQTKRINDELWNKLEFSNNLNMGYLTKKWGPYWRTVWPSFHPFDKEDIPISYTTYDLEFVRKKHLGF